jgi:hypothetical protein
LARTLYPQTTRLSADSLKPLLQINHAAVVAVGFAAAAFDLLGADVALDEIFGGELRGREQILRESAIAPPGPP